MERQFVNYTLEDGIATVTIDHPPMNTLDVPTRQELADVFDELTAKKGEVRVVILTSAGEVAEGVPVSVSSFPRRRCEKCL